MALELQCCLTDHSRLGFSLDLQPRDLSMAIHGQSNRRQSSPGWKSQSLKGCNWPCQKRCLKETRGYPTIKTVLPNKTVGPQEIGAAPGIWEENKITLEPNRDGTCLSLGKIDSFAASLWDWCSDHSGWGPRIRGST